MCKENICQGACDAAHPGEAAEIEKWTCVDGITQTRTRELQYPESGTGLTDFFHATDTIFKYYENGNRNRFIGKLADKFLVNDDSNWNLYITENCKLAVSRFGEEKKDCMARQSSYRY
ncbi:hypothetical protein QS306_04535 [Paraburkholderia bonniea]|uniref:hypothetical protein n=1 Tax=Paraburkholderia bonniea TaxID=2152891 RepID=UPI0025729A37|nr:hypothetical protein [Paraburkholderia bonniea]WJF90936.1 hypothetical protein QS306_04535 [Paraburkholderia bonniea]WJF94250.1 hypothetical protein QS308_04540 [Paraburkholderia bonniea]